MNANATFQEVMAEYNTLGSMFKKIIRNVASDSLLEMGAQEIGSSDVNHQIVVLYRIHGDFDAIFRHGLEMCR